MSNLHHGHKRVGHVSPTYYSWSSMLNRVRNNPRYIVKGIDVDPRWESFEVFLADMGERPEGMTIERIDNDKGYWPGNCKWGTRTEQSRNRTGRRVVTFENEEMLLVQAIERSGIPVRVFEQRVYRRGWDVMRALTTPMRSYPR